MKIQEYLQNKKIICDGAFGTYFAALVEEDILPEKANTQSPEVVKKIHSGYLDAGAVLLRTNTFASNRVSLQCGEEYLVKNIRAAWKNASDAAIACGKELGKDCFIAGDIGPIPGSVGMQEEETYKEYKLICDTFIAEGADILVFETFMDIERILPVIKAIKAEKEIFIIVQFCVNQRGYSNAGISARRLIQEAGRVAEIDAVGLNCGVGPRHLYGILDKIDFPEGKYITALPNAGYPKLIKNRMIFMDNAEYFTRKMNEISRRGADILGGCCGTTPEYIRLIKESISLFQGKREASGHAIKEVRIKPKDSSFWRNKQQGEKLIAVEISPPPGADDEKVMEAAFRLKDNKADVITFPDSPSGRTRADSILMSMKVAQETGLCVMPHICCRDKNAIAMRSQLLGAYINGIRNMLVVTGDPVPTLIRQEVKSVFNFDSVGLMKIISELNQEEFVEDPIVFGGALNHNRPNLEVEVGRVRKKMAQGAGFFLTQPVFTIEEANKLCYIKQQTNARILCGIMPLVSLRNAQFIKNEMAGINVTEAVIARFLPEMTREEGENVGIEIAKNVIDFTEDFVDGYYFSIPFNRVYLLEKILKE
ncbi:MAG: bifunctional homocysteine S-methyltransferase/methylenetetrahydrofolate reductase [Clostridiales bacterium]|nr:bifunctional homocysteine S-methyltransferase/methylenetetrahydrofolate reductase [Clostridiales bacterium]